MAKITQATRKLLKLNKRIRAVAGGTGASKTYSILMILIDYAQSNKNQIIDIVSESYPHLEKGAIRDFRQIMTEHNYWNDTKWNESKHSYTFETNSTIQFQSVDTVGKAHGPRRDVLFLNECNYIDFAIVDQLITRTRKIVWMDWNPTSEFWFYTEMQGKRNDVDFVKLTYLDNEAITPEERAEIESHRTNAQWWKVYGEGELGELIGKIYIDWKIIDEIPHEARLERRWIDFGYTNDPTAIGDVYYLNGGYILDELCYQRGMTNPQIAQFIKNFPQTINVADSSEPKSIDEIKQYGIDIIPAEKGPDSVRNGISIIQDQRISVTRRSVNIIKEYRNYLWLADKSGKPMNVPLDLWNHHMDGIRYAITNLKRTGIEPEVNPLIRQFDRQKAIESARRDVGL